MTTRDPRMPAWSNRAPWWAKMGRVFYYIGQDQRSKEREAAMLAQYRRDRATTPDRCPRCDKPPAVENGHGADGNGCTCPECLAMCWAEWGTPCQPVDWRERCLAAEAVVAKLEPHIRQLEAVLDAPRAEAVWSQERQWRYENLVDAAAELVDALWRYKEGK